VAVFLCGVQRLIFLLMKVSAVFEKKPDCLGLTGICSSS
jgi:hypothetical protein